MSWQIKEFPMYQGGLIVLLMIQKNRKKREFNYAYGKECNMPIKIECFICKQTGDEVKKFKCKDEEIAICEKCLDPLMSHSEQNKNVYVGPARFNNKYQARVCLHKSFIDKEVVVIKRK